MSTPLALLAGDTRAALVDTRDLDVLMQRLEQLTPDGLATLEALGAPFAPTLREAAAGQLTRELRHDLRVSLAALRTMADHLAAPASSRPLSAEALRLHHSPVDLTAHLRAWVEAFRPLADARAIALELDAPAPRPCTVDLGKLETVVLNLLFNAFKYTPTRGRVIVRLDAPAGATDAVLSVRDDGPPVPEAEWHAIFDRARQLERNVFSLGFNLGVSLAYCQLHGGTLELRRPRDGGCAFAARWSMNAPRGISPGAPAAVDDTFARAVAEVAARELEAEATLGVCATDGSRPTVLIIESARALHRALVDCLRDGFNTLSAFDGREGLDLALRKRPDLIVADTGAPGLEGEAFVRAVRAAPQLENASLLVLAAYDDVAAVRTLEAGANDLLRKPFLLQEARARITGLVAAKRARDILNDTLGRRDADLIRLANDARTQQKALQSTLEELNAAREVAERASLVKSNFLRMISHELATPVAALQLHVQALAKDPSLALGGPTTEGLRRTGRVSRRLHHLVDTMVAWARVESGRLKRTVSNFDVATLVQEVVEEVRSYATEKDLALNLQLERWLPPLPSDKKLVHLVLIDLIGFVVQNAPSGRVDVSVVPLRSGLQVRVRDTARRISAGDRADLFSPLESIADLRWRSGHGSGLGLYVVRDLARAVAGELELDAGFQGPGNLFVLTLPALPHPEVHHERRVH